MFITILLKSKIVRHCETGSTFA